MSAYTHDLAEIGRRETATVGGKGASLGELIRAGIPVPAGFVISTAAYQAFLSASDNRQYVEQTLQDLNGGRISASDAATKLADHLHHTPVPTDIVAAIAAATVQLGAERVSVRSSATCEDGATSAWAGQLETYLDVSPEEVVEKVRDCWLSIFREPPLVYGAAHGYGAGQFGVAVVVQQMVNSEVSGVAFSVHPVTQEPEIQLIEAGLGLGEAVVSGRVVPDHYLIQRRSGQILDRSISRQREGLFMNPKQAGATWREVGQQGNKQKLTDDQVLEYAAILDRIEQHFGHPVDTEWGLEKGEFRVLQARPITTLAQEYRDAVIDLDYDWQFLVRRPMPLVEASIVAHWVDSEHVDPQFGTASDRMMAIEDDAGLTNNFFAKSAADDIMGHLVDLYQTDRPRLRRILEYGHDLYRQSQATIEKGADAFASIDEAVDFFANVAQHTTAIPAWMLIQYELNGFDDPVIRQLAEELRSHTLYPAIQRRIIEPIVTREAAAVGFAAPQEAIKLTTWSELRRGRLDRKLLEDRYDAVRENHRFVFTSIDGNDDVRFVSQTSYLLMRIAKERGHKLVADDPDELVGQAAFPGVVRGRARVVLAPDAIGQTFEEGEILVSIQSSPALMPLLLKCAGIVTDDGGIACHASIIARELKKPTLTGTGTATSVIHTGDLVEVDAYAQKVQILERAGGH